MSRSHNPFTMTSGGPAGIHPRMQSAVALHQAGRLQDAAKIYRAILAEAPRQVEALHMLGVIALQEGQFAEASSKIGKALELDPRNESALSNMTVVHLRSRQLSEALKWGRRALDASPQSVDALVNLGTVLHELGEHREAIPLLQRARDAVPNSVIICNLLGSCFLQSGNPAAAIELFEASVSVAPNDADCWSNLSAALNGAHDHERALECANRSIELRANSSNALAAQAASLLELGRVDDAVASYREAANHSPTVETLCAFANALITAGINDEAQEVLRRAIELDESSAPARWRLAIAALKPIYETDDEMRLAREHFAEEMTGLSQWFAAKRRPNAYQAVGVAQPFYLAYMEMNNRQLLQQHGRLCAEWMSTLPPVMRSTRAPIERTSKFRIGIVSAHVSDHSVWIAVTKGWVLNLDRKRFEIFIFSLNPTVDKESLAAKQAADFYDDRVKGVDDWVDSIKKANLDALIYPGIGMDPMTYQLASLRLAPLQAVSWGHPETSGLPEIDYYLSGSALEPADADQNYSEKLVRLPKFGVYVEPLTPKIKDPNLAALGLPKKQPLLLCPGAPFKYIPANDWIWVEIAKGLEEIGSGRMVFFANAVGSTHINLITRLRKSFHAAGVPFDSRVSVIPILDRARYYGLMHESCLLLDTFGFSGFNTALQALECNLPVLAFEGQFMRGRLASGILREMELPELIATTHAEFVRKALEFVADERGLKQIRSQIAKRQKPLFRDLTAVRALETFLAAEIMNQREDGQRIGPRL